MENSQNMTPTQPIDPWVNHGNANAQAMPVNNAEKTEGVAIASLVLGIITLILCLPLSAVMIPFSITGLILGICAKKKSGAKIAGIILNSLSIVGEILMVLIIAIALKTTVDLVEDSGFAQEVYSAIQTAATESVSGNYNCKEFYDGNGSESDDYAVTLNLYADNTFIYGPYGDLANNYAKGAFTETDLNKTTSDNSYKYFNVKMTGDDFVVDGVKSENGFNSEFEMGVTRDVNGNKEGIVYFPHNGNMYYCYTAE